MPHYTIEPVGYIKTCFPEKFGIPRQPSLAPAAKGQLILLPPFNDSACIEGLEQCSHIWLNFIFHENIEKGWKPKVRPPRLGGNQKMGVFATRSPFRPNALGLSVVELESIDRTPSGSCLNLAGVDLMDGTPIIDIKPYVPYTDAVINAVNQFAEAPPKLTPVFFSQVANHFLQKQQREGLKLLVTQVLQQNPQPAYHRIDPARTYKMALYHYTIVWRCAIKDTQAIIEVDDIIIST